MKLSKEQINEIKLLKEQGKTQKEIKEKFNVSISTIQYHTNEKYKIYSKNKSSNRIKNLPIEERKKIQEKQKEYQRAYQHKRYNEDNEFRLKCIQRTKDSKRRRNDINK
jgi:transposase